MYTLSLSTGEVTRLSDSKVVAPCQSAEDADFVAYIDWVESGGEPAIVE